MKNLIYLLLLLPLSGFSQTIKNGSFESWITTLYDKPDVWRVSNAESFVKTGQLSALQTSDSHNGSAIKISTVSDNNDTVGGYVVNSTADDPIAGYGGIPYAAMPTHFTGYYKYNLPGNDSALIFVLFKSGGIIVSQDMFKIHVTGQLLTYTAFSFPLSLTVMADTVIIAAASSNLLIYKGEPGSTLYLDELTFTGTGTMPPISNGDFENWSTASFDMLTSWDYSGEENLSKTNDSYHGSFAVQLESDYNGGNERISSITNGIQNAPGAAGGLPYALQYDTLSFYYKYNNNSGDSAPVSVSFYQNGINYWGYHILLGPAATYTYSEIPISLPFAPDTMKLIFQSSDYPFTNIGLGSTLILDEIQLASAPLNTGISFSQPTSFFVYPNPVSDVLTIRFPENMQVISG